VVSRNRAGVLTEHQTNGGILMKTSGRASRSLLIGLVATLLIAMGQAEAAVSCHKINAKGIGQDNFDLTTQADITGGGLLNGTTASTLVATGFVFPDYAFGGTIVFTTKHATLTASIAGTLDVTTGAFSATANVTGGTGKLAGATGTLSFDGVEDLSTGRFVEDVDGIVCADLSH
jgi:hypothetical protein